MRRGAIGLILLALAAPHAAAEPAATQLSPAARRMLTVPSPCPGPMCAADQPLTPQPAAQGLRIIYLNFEGVTLTGSNTADDAPSNTSAIVTAVVGPGNPLTIAPFSTADLVSTEGLSRDQIISRIIDDLYRLHADFNVEYTTSRPASGPYSMVVFGGSCSGVAGQQGCGGIALLDCGDMLPSDITFVFPPGLRVADLATVAAQEAAHAFGLGHTLDTDDVMYPQLQQSVPSRFGGGNIPNGDANCQGGGFQDSHQRMLDVIGARGADSIGPSVRISEPLSGAVIFVGETVAASATDPSDVARVDLVIGGQPVASAEVAPYSFVVPESAALGAQTIEVQATDGLGNLSSDRVEVYIGSDADAGCDGDGDCGGGAVCLRGICVDRSGGLGSLCGGPGDCDSALCANHDDETRCSTDCGPDLPCPAGFECISDTACWPSSGDSSFLGLCQAGGDGSGAAIVFLALLVTGLGYRKRR